MGRGFIQRRILDELNKLRDHERAQGVGGRRDILDITTLARAAYGSKGRPTFAQVEATRRSVRTLAEQGLVERVREGWQAGARVPLDPAEDAGAVAREAELRQINEQIASLERRRNELLYG